MGIKKIQTVIRRIKKLIGRFSSIAFERLDRFVEDIVKFVFDR